MVVDAGKEDSCESKNINKKGKQSYKEREGMWLCERDGQNNGAGSVRQ